MRRHKVLSGFHMDKHTASSSMIVAVAICVQWEIPFSKVLQCPLVVSVMFIIFSDEYRNDSRF